LGGRKIPPGLDLSIRFNPAWERESKVCSRPQVGRTKREGKNIKGGHRTSNSPPGSRAHKKKKKDN